MADTNSTLSPIEQLINTIYYQADKIAGTSKLLRDHADRLYGPLPESTTKDGAAAAPAADGAMGHVGLALEFLGNVIDTLALEADRNTRVA